MTPGIPKNLVIVMKEKGTNRNNQNRLNRLSPERISKKSMTENHIQNVEYVLKMLK